MARLGHLLQRSLMPFHKSIDAAQIAHELAARKVPGRWLSWWPAPGISFLGVIVSAKKHRLPKCEPTRQSSFCTHVCAANLWRIDSRRRDAKTNIFYQPKGTDNGS